MFEDLTYEAQRRLLDEAGIESPVEVGWDINPVSVIDLDKEGHYQQNKLGDNEYDLDHDVP